jgi:hypothetical protein
MRKDMGRGRIIESAPFLQLLNGYLEERKVENTGIGYMFSSFFDYPVFLVKPVFIPSTVITHCSIRLCKVSLTLSLRYSHDSLNRA